MAEVVGDLWQLVRDYAKQEVVDPLKSVGRFLAFGVAGALLLGLGTLFAALAALRGLQTNDHLQGSLTWVPYLVALVICTLVIAVAVKKISGPKSDQARS